MRKNLAVLILLIIDWFTAALSWSVFYYLRKISIEHQEFHVNNTFYLGVTLVPIAWILLYYLQGTYHDIKRLYRLKLFNLTFIATIIGTTLIFFILILDDLVSDYQLYYKSFFMLLGIHFFTVFFHRYIFITVIVKRIQSGKNGFRTLLIGGSDKAVELYNEISKLPKNVNRIVGFININGVDKQLEDRIPYLGNLNDIEQILINEQIEEVIIAIESKEHDKLRSIIARIQWGTISIKILPDMYDILSGSVKMTNIFGALLIQLDNETMPFWQQALKRFIDVFVSVIAIIVLFPFYLIMAIAVKLSSQGPVFFLQDRIGLNGEVFKIIKFRTMYIDAEKLGPQLSSTDDPRITKIGKYMRKLRLDEFPQFINVLKGDMSLVGPRPERQFYIDQIVKIEPQFLHLTKVRPGITSWGQVKYGYAENVEQMLQRMKYDLLYMRNRTLALDFKIMFYTIIIIFRAKGK